MPETKIVNCPRCKQPKPINCCDLCQPERGWCPWCGDLVCLECAQQICEDYLQCEKEQEKEAVNGTSN